jgi:hypothetical protein
LVYTSHPLRERQIKDMTHKINIEEKEKFEKDCTNDKGTLRINEKKRRKYIN